MLRRYGPFLAALAVVAGLFIWSENAIAPHFQSCIREYAAKGSNEKGKEESGIIAKGIAAQAVCTLQLIDRHNGFFSALAAFAVALFTWTLWRSSEDMWGVTKKSADIAERALVDLERPYVFVRRIRSDMRSFLSAGTSWNQERGSPTFVLDLINYGRTPANIDSAALIFQVDRAIPEEFRIPEHPATDGTIPPGESIEIIIGPDKKYSFASQRLRHIFPFAYARGIREGTMHVFSHGLINYHDIFGRGHTTKWCRRYNPTRDEWQPDGGRERNQAD